MQKATDILKSSGLSKTHVRLKVLDTLLESANALSLQNIESALNKVDRVTLYRTLKAFESKGIIHKAIDGTKHPKYALCLDDCAEHDHNDDHAHFHCTSCEKTICLEEVTFPRIQVPQGFQVDQTNIILTGRCADCH